MALIISSEVVVSTPPAHEDVLSLTHPRILYDDIVGDASTVLTVTSEQVGFEVEHIADYLTWDFWRPSALPATVTITTEEAAAVDYALIAAHSLGSSGASFKLEYHNGTTWVSITESAPGKDRVVVALFDEIYSNQYRMTLAGGAIMPSVGVLMLGKALAVERKLYRGHTPITLGKRTVKQPNKSEGGQWLGTSIRREGAGTTITFANLTATWIRQKFEPFMEVARSQPFGWVWRPETFPAEVAYCAAVEDIRPTNQGPRDLMSVSFTVDGLLD